MNRVTPKSPDEVREILPAYDDIEASFGFVPTSMHVMAHRPPILEGFTQMAGAILGPGVVDAGLKQLVAHVVSRTTGCLYCQAHTGHRAHSLGVDEAKLQAVWEFESDDRFTAAERAALALARESALTPKRGDRRPLRSAPGALRRAADRGDRGGGLAVRLSQPLQRHAGECAGAGGTGVRGGASWGDRVGAR